MQDLVSRLFSRLTDTGVPWCILRNADLIPDGLAAWQDIDVLVPEEMSVKRLASLLAPLHPAQIGPMRRGHVSFYFPAADVFLRLDVFFGDIRWKSAAFVDHREVLASRALDSGYLVASPLHQAYVTWLSKLLWDGTVPERYHAMIMAETRNEPGEMYELVARAFGPDLGSRLVDLALAGHVEESRRYGRTCRRALWRRQARKHPAETIGGFLAQIRHGLDQRRRPSGLYVALLGPDGSGKSSVAAAIAELRMRQVAFKNVQSRLGYRQTLPPIRTIASTILRRPVPPDSTHLDPHGATPHPLPMWLLKFGYYTLDQWLEQVWMRQKLAHTSLVLKDRHLMELPIDPLRYRFTGPRALARLVARLQPKPDVVIVLDAPTGVLQARKQEVPPEETSRQRIAYLQLADSLPHGYVVSSDQPLDPVVHDVIDIINREAAARTRERFYPWSTQSGTSGSLDTRTLFTTPNGQHDPASASVPQVSRKVRR